MPHRIKDLTPNSTIALISTARAITPEELAPAIEVLGSWGLRVKLGKHVYNKWNQFAGTDEERAADLQWALDDDEVDAVLCTRGGYGTVRVLERVDFSRFERRPKWICGYSDVTVLHNHLNNERIPTIHSTMPVNFPTNTPEALESLRKALFGDQLNYHEKVEVYREGTTEGLLVGGNLSILYALTGTPSQLETSGKILFLEDLDEHLYHVDRMMMNLKRAGMLDDLAGLIVGDVMDMRDHLKEHGFSKNDPFGKNAVEIIKEHTAEYNYPVCFGFPAGHVKDNRALVMGKEWRMELEDGALRLI